MSLDPTGTMSTLMPSATTSMTSSVTVQDQVLTVDVASVVSDGPGWVVIHADNNGAPGMVLGHAAVSDGENTNISVPIVPSGLRPQSGLCCTRMPVRSAPTSSRVSILLSR